jgi:UDP-N-acetylglucosamine 2-epimerase (non-hydrolysing)
MTGPHEEGLRALTEEVPVIFPVHPRTRARIETLGATVVASERLMLVEPLGYLPFLGLQARARFVLTDSGGVQEETSALGTPCFTLRDSTERPITISLGTNVLLGAQPERIADITARAAGDLGTRASIPLWDGKAGPRAAAALLRSLDG